MQSVIWQFQAAIDARDAQLLAPLLDPDVRLLGSVQHAAFEGRDTVLFIFGMLIALFQDARYVAEIPGAEAVVLLMHGTISGQEADGLQVVSFGDDGKITHFLDFVRPLPALGALQEAATAYLANIGSRYRADP
ncbi:MAG: hypothetical protein QOI03_1535 [Solirubrobacteraceae bacterium]|nr:hypothetical protein [Solirubrobacteraceae bacterium]